MAASRAAVQRDPRRQEDRVAALLVKTPSPADVPGRLILTAIAALAAVWSFQPLVHDDVFWHIRTGEWIAHHGSVPLQDFFSFTRLGERWITHEWGFSALTAAAYGLGGFAGLLALTAGIMLLTGWLVWRRCPTHEPYGPTAAAAALGLSLLAVQRLVFLRPALVGELLFAASLWLLDRYRTTRKPALLVLVLLVFWLWANVHSGVIFGLFVLGLQALEGLLPIPSPPAVAPAPSRPVRWLLPAVCAVAAGVCLINPNGLDTLRFPFLLNRVFFHSGIAWDLGQFESYSPTSNTPLMLLAVLVLIGWLRARPEERPRPWEILAIAAFVLMSLRASRFVFSLVIVLVPVASRLWARPAGEPGRRARAARWATAAVMAGVAAVAVATSPVRWPPRYLDRSLPVGAARFLQQHALRGHMFHHANHGGYLYFAVGQPIFWDGRNDVFWPVTHEVGTTDFRVLVARYDIDVLVVTEREYRDLREEAEGPDWGLVYWDDAAAVYLRRDRFAAALAQLELRYFRAFGGSAEDLKKLATQPAIAQAARAELERLLALWPENQRALYFLGVMDLYRGDLAAARNALGRAIALGSNELLEKTLAAVEAARDRR